MKSTRMNLRLIFAALAAFPLAGFASVVNVTGNIYSSGGTIYTNGGPIYTTAGNVGTYNGSLFTSNGYVQAQTYFYTPGYLNIVGQGYIGNFLRIGGNSNTPATKSVQIGQHATTDSFNSLVVGQYNVNKAKDGATAPSSTTWVGDDPLFVVGNGSDANNLNNAFTVYKDGTITMSQAQGDISMGQFGN